MLPAWITPCANKFIIHPNRNVCKVDNVSAMVGHRKAFPHEPERNLCASANSASCLPSCRRKLSWQRLVLVPLAAIWKRLFHSRTTAGWQMRLLKFKIARRVKFRCGRASLIPLETRPDSESGRQLDLRKVACWRKRLNPAYWETV